ncbi:FAD-dependent oxidoreductase [Streptomyces tricolor]|nr:FAD-dependent oxidoreductase [Streptomyces tricolor]
MHRHPRPAARPARPLADVKPWTSREATSAASAPGRLIVVGGGVVATEMATAWQALGPGSPLLVRGKGLLNRMEPFAGELVAEALTEAGVDVRTGTSVESVGRADGTVVAVTSAGDRIEADEIPSPPAASRTPTTSAWRPSAWNPAPGWTSTTACASPAPTGCTGSATSTTARSSPTGASTRPASPAPPSPPARRRRRAGGALGRPRRHRRPPRRCPRSSSYRSGGPAVETLRSPRREQAGHRVRAVDVEFSLRRGRRACTATATGAAPGLVVDLEDEDPARGHLRRPRRSANSSTRPPSPSPAVPVDRRGTRSRRTRR